MAKYEPPANINIAAMRQEQENYVDLMASGPGTPWEDRGSYGVVMGFLKTAWMSLFQPAKLFALIRRPNATPDANGFVIGSGVMWSIAVAVDAVRYYIENKETLDPATDLLTHFALILAAPFILYGLLTIVIRVFSAMVDNELRRGTPQALAINVISYAAGASLAAPLLVLLRWPVAWTGIILAIAWIAFAGSIGAKTRMRLSTAGATIAMILGTVAACLLAVGIYLGLRVAWKLVSI
jgi:hypothetical protein